MLEIERLQKEIEKFSRDIPGIEDSNRMDNIHVATTEISIITENIKANKETAVQLEKSIKTLELEAATLIRVLFG